MKQTFYSRIGAFLIITTIITLGIVWIPVFAHPTCNFSVFVICILVSLLMIAIMFGIRYVVEGHTLKIYTLCFHTDIDIRTITKIEPSRCMLSAPAASLNRLAIHYGKGEMALISPKHQDEFLDLINKIREDNKEY